MDKQVVTKLGRLFGFCLVALGVVLAPCAQAQEQQKAPPINEQVVQMLVKSAIMALNHANLTGNYSVLRELGSAQFQLNTSSAILSDSFSSLRRDNINLQGTLVFPAKLTAAPELNDNVARFTGVFETRPSQVNFDISYQFMNGRWRINGLTVGLSKPGEAGNNDAIQQVTGKKGSKPKSED